MVLLSTHIVSDVEYIADRILLMKDGSLLHAGDESLLLSKAAGDEKKACQKRFPVTQFVEFHFIQTHGYTDWFCSPPISFRMWSISQTRSCS